MFDFSFIALFNLVIALAVIYCLWKAVGKIAVWAFRIEVRGEELEEGVDLFDYFRPKWLVAGALIGLFLIFNPIDLSISEQSRTHHIEQRKITAEKYRDIPPKVEVDARRDLDKSVQEFDNSVEEIGEHNEAHQHVDQ